MESERTRGWWLTRIELAVGLSAVLFAVVVFVSMPPISEPMDREGHLLAAIGLVAMAIGLLWMMRIFRGPRDEPPPWRYRNR